MPSERRFIRRYIRACNGDFRRLLRAALQLDEVLAVRRGRRKVGRPRKMRSVGQATDKELIAAGQRAPVAHAIGEDVPDVGGQPDAVQRPGSSRTKIVAADTRNTMVPAKNVVASTSTAE